MSFNNRVAIVCRDRNEIDRLIVAFFAGDSTCRDMTERMPPVVAQIFRQTPCRCFCVQRYPKFLEDHTIVDNWSLPLWDVARQDDDAWHWLHDEARSIMKRYSEMSPLAYPAQLDDIARIAAHFSQAHMLLPDVLLLDGVLSDWHASDRSTVSRMLEDFVARHPLRPVLHLDLVPPPAALAFQTLELVAA